MRIPRIYTQATLQLNDLVQLDPQASSHLARVLRMQVGDLCTLFNGDGNEYQGAIAQLEGKKQVAVTINQVNEASRESPLATHLGLVMSRGDRMDYAIQKATELGVHAITPLTSERCELKLKGNRADKKIQHWQQVSISACEQCQRNKVPTIYPATDINEWIKVRNEQLKLVLHHRASKPLQSFAETKEVALLIGPEGGLSEREIDLAETQEFHSVLFGPRVLRTETAPLVALTALQMQWGDF